MWLFIAFLAIPLIEIGLFIQVGGAIGLWPTLAIVVLTAFLGTTMIRAQGVLAMTRLRSSLNDMRDPTEPLAHGAMILIAGALLLTPGFFTDAIGFLLLIPPVRSSVYTYVRSRVSVNNFSMGTAAPKPRQSVESVIEGDFVEVDQPENSGPPGDSGWTKH